MNRAGAGGSGADRSRARESGDSGTSLIDLIVALAVAAVLAGLAAPVAAHAVDAGRARQAAGFVAAQMRLARQQAVFTARSVGLVFEQAGGRWTFSVCTDGNGNGLRRADISAGRDTCDDGPHDIGVAFRGMAIAVDPQLPGPDDEAGTSDPVRFGSSDIASFSPAGTCTAGTLFLRSEMGAQFAVRVANVTGRTRLLRYDSGAGKWVSW